MSMTAHYPVISSAFEGGLGEALFSLPSPACHTVPGAPYLTSTIFFPLFQTQWQLWQDLLLNRLTPEALLARHDLSLPSFLGRVLLPHVSTVLFPGRKEKASLSSEASPLPPLLGLCSITVPLPPSLSSDSLFFFPHDTYFLKRSTICLLECPIVWICFLKPTYVLTLGSLTYRAKVITPVPATPDSLQP